MKTKFQVGDKVKVIKNVLGEDSPMEMGVSIGNIGKVIEYDNTNYFAPYCVERRNGNSDWFNVRELERVS